MSIFLFIQERECVCERVRERKKEIIHTVLYINSNIRFTSFTSFKEYILTSPVSIAIQN